MPPARRPRKAKPKKPTRDELLADLAAAVKDKSINVQAIRLLLEEMRRDDDQNGSGQGGFDALDETSNVTPIRRPKRAS